VNEYQVHCHQKQEILQSNTRGNSFHVVFDVERIVIIGNMNKSFVELTLGDFPSLFFYFG
jgi:hypothetical protein